MNYTLSTTTTTHYTEAIASGESERETFPRLTSDGIGMIDTVFIRSLEKLAWQFEILDGSYNVIHKQTFTEEDAIEQEISEVTYYFYSASNLGWAIPRSVPSASVSANLRNMSVTAKTAGTSGEVLVQLQICK